MQDLVGDDTCWQPGDLIFTRHTGGQHVALYLGNNKFADAYNSEVGVIIHDIVADSYYWDHFWQARRIVSCDGVTVTPPDADPLPYLPPSLEEIPNIIGSVSFVVPQCGACNDDGTIILPPTQWAGSWPQGWEALDLPLVFRTVISWLAWQISEIARLVICWLLSMLARLASFLASAANALIFGVNSLFKILVFTWLTLRVYFVAAWGLLESMRWLLYLVASGLAGLADQGRLLLELLALLAGFIGQLLALLGQIAIVLLGILGWIGGLVLGFFGQLQLAFTGTTVPVQLSSSHVIYRATRGVLEGVRDSDIGWVFIVLWAMAYVALITWASRFLSAGKGGGE